MSKLKYTLEKPSCEGWYWQKYEKNFPARIIFIKKCFTTLLIEYRYELKDGYIYFTEYIENYPYSQWAGPIENPEE